MGEHAIAEPRWIDVSAPTVQLRALHWGPDEGPIALCLHGFPDTAYGFRRLATHLVAAGYRVIAPFMRGYVPSSLPTDRAYHLGALMDDALRVRDASNPTDADVVIGHDWGAVAANGLAAMPDSPFRRAVVMSVPPSAALTAGRSASLLRLLPVRCCAAGTSGTSSSRSPRSAPHRGSCRCCGGGGRPVTGPVRTCATWTPRSGLRTGGVPRWARTAQRSAIIGRRPAMPNCTGGGPPRHGFRRCTCTEPTMAA